MDDDSAVDPVLAEQRSFYAVDAVDYDAWLRSLEDVDNHDPLAAAFRTGRGRVAQFLAHHAPLGALLDIAAGNGILSELAAAAGAESLVLLDSSEPSLRLAADRLVACNVACDVELVSDDVFAWDAGGRRFDTIVFSSWFHHVPRRELGRFWHTIDRLLRPGGQVMFDFPTAETAVTASPSDLPSRPTEEYSLYAPVEGISIRDHRGRRWKVVHELWSRDDLVAELDQRGWTVTDSVPGWWQQFEWLRLRRR